MPKTLLLADDSVTIQKVVGISFANEDVVLLTVDNGDDAVARAREARPDLVLADVMMPGKDGYEVCEILKSDPELRHVPVLLLSGTFEPFDEERARRVGADGHITKPFEAQALVDQVNALLARADAAAVSAPQPAASDATLFMGEDGAAGDAFDFVDDAMARTAPSPRSLQNLAPDPDDDGEPLELEAAVEDDEPVFGPPAPAQAPPFAREGDSQPTVLFGEMPLDATRRSATPLAFDAELEPAPPAAPAAAPASAPVSLVADPEADAPAGYEESFDFGFEDGLDAPAAPAASPAPPPVTAGAPAQTAPPSAPAPAAEPLGFEPFRSPWGDPEPEEWPREPERPQTTSQPQAPAPTPFAMPPAPPAASEPPPIASLQPPPVPATPPVASAEPLFAPALPSMPSTPPPFAAAPPVPEPTPPPIPGALDSPHATSPPAAMHAAATPPPAPTPVLAEEREAPETPLAVRVTGPSALSEPVQKQLQETLEKIVWEAFGELTERIVRDVIERVEAVAWEVIPQMAETLIREEIRRLKEEDDA